MALGLDLELDYIWDNWTYLGQSKNVNTDCILTNKIVSVLNFLERGNGISITQMSLLLE